MGSRRGPRDTDVPIAVSRRTPGHSERGDADGIRLGPKHRRGGAVHLGRRLVVLGFFQQRVGVAVEPPALEAGPAVAQGHAVPL